MAKKRYRFTPSIKDYASSALFALTVLVLMHWISYSKSYHVSLQPFVGVVSFILVFIPILTILKHRKYSVTIDNGVISGFDLNSKKRISRDISAVTSFGIEKGLANTNPKNHLAFVDHLFIDLSSGERLVIFLKGNKLKELLSDLEQLKNR